MSMMICTVTGKACEYSGCIGTGCVKQTGAAAYVLNAKTMTIGGPLPTQPNDVMREALIEARDCIESWAAYASDYFREKHDLAGDLARIDAALALHQANKPRDVDG